MQPYSCLAQRKARKGQAPGSMYADSIESLVRNKIQKIKIDMANEVIDAGRFDMQTSMAERKETLESMLQARTASALLTLHHPAAAGLRAQATCTDMRLISRRCFSWPPYSHALTVSSTCVGQTFVQEAD